ASLAVSSASAVIGAAAARGSWGFPATTTDALFLTEYEDLTASADFGVNAVGYGVAMTNGGYIGTSTFPVTEATWHGAFSAWSEGVLAIPQVAQATTTTTQTVTSTSVITSTSTTTSST